MRSFCTAFLLLALGLATSVGCGRKGMQQQATPSLPGPQEAVATPSGDEGSPTVVTPSPGEEPPEPASKAPAKGSSSSLGAPTTQPPSQTARPGASPRLARPAATVQVSLTKETVEAYLSSYPKVMQAMQQFRPQQGAAPPADRNAWRQQMEKMRGQSQQAVGKALEGSGLTAEKFWGLDARVRLAMRRLQNEQGGPSSPQPNAPGLGAKSPPSRQGAPPAGQVGKGPTSEQWRQMVEERRKQMEKDMASLPADEVALVKQYQQQIESAWSKAGFGRSGGFQRGGGRPTT